MLDQSREELRDTDQLPLPDTAAEMKTPPDSTPPTHFSQASQSAATVTVTATSAHSPCSPRCSAKLHSGPLHEHRGPGRRSSRQSSTHLPRATWEPFL